MFRIGADPELFMQDATNSFVSAVDLIGGSKRDPRPLADLGPGFAVQEDNVAVEYNIPPAESKAQLVNHIGKIMSYLSDEVATRYGLKFVNVSATTEFPEFQLAHPKAQEFGCDPDFNAWKGGKRNPRPKADDHRLRTCGGHVHIGYKFINKQAIVDFMKHMDLYLCVPSMLMDKGELRRELYGKAGAFRVKPYGAEYRSLSNFWVFDKKYVEWVWDATSMAMAAWQQNKINIDAEADLILDAINNNNKNAAQALVQRHNLLVV